MVPAGAMLVFFWLQAAAANGRRKQRTGDLRWLSGPLNAPPSKNGRAANGTPTSTLGPTNASPSR